MNAATTFAARMVLLDAGLIEQADSGAFHVGLTFLCDYCDSSRERVVLADSGRGGFVSVSVCADHIERAL